MPSASPRSEPSKLKARLLLVLAFMATAVAYLSGGLEFLEREITDFKFSVTRRQPSADLALVAIDARSLHAMGVWPWPRNLHATLIDRLIAAGARRIAFDVDFSSPSSAEADADLERALEAADGKVVLAAHKQLQRDREGTRLVYTVPLPRFARHAVVATTNVIPDADGLVRRMQVRDRWGDRFVPSLSAYLADAEAGPAETFWVDFAIDPFAIPRISFSDALAGRFDPEAIDGKTVIVGATAIELGDRLPVPLYKSLSGALLLGLGAESLHQGRALQRIGPAPVLAIVGLLAMLLGPGFFTWSARRALAVTVSSLVAIVALSLVAQCLWPVLVDAAPPLTLVLLLLPCGLISGMDRQSWILLAQRSQLYRTHTLMRSIVESNFDGILIVRQDGTIELANPALAALFQLAPAALSDAHVRSLIPGLATQPEVPGAAIRIGHGHRELVGVRADGSSFPVEVATSEIAEGDGRMFVAVVHDISARKARQRELEHQALHDSLTGLPNRRLIMDRLEHALGIGKRENKPLSLLLLDLDRFKDVNDTLGHQVGDLLLRQVAERLPGALRRSDTIGRLGGDEFAVVLPATTDLLQAVDVARRIVKSLAQPFRIENIALEVGASVGIALYPDHAEDATHLLRCADVAMYAAKKERAAIALYDPATDENTPRNLTLTGELREAIDRKALFLAFQPKIDLRTRRVCGVEALARWVHPVHGFIPPDQFVALAERTGLIEGLTAWALESALGQLAQLQGKVPGLTMAVNLSTRALHNEKLPKMVQGLIRKWAIDPAHLMLEITESALMDNPERALATVNGLHDLGLRVSIDDFGTGYSSLAYLKSLPVAELKIDRCFVTHMHENEKEAQIVRSTIDLAHGLGLKVVAEGIETEAHLAALAAFGCDVGQGYLFAKPLASREWLEWADATPWCGTTAGSGASAQSAA